MDKTWSTTIWVSAAHASAFAAALALSVGPLAPALAQDGDKPAPTSQDTAAPPAGGLGGLGQVAEQQTSPDQQRFESAQRMFAEEQYAAAAVAFHELSVEESAAALKDASEYNLGKALYRLKLNHSALAAFEKILARGPTGKYYRSSQEWSLFIARKIAGDDRVLATVAKYGDGKFPEEHKNEFRFELARYHYARAQAVESGSEIGALGEARAEETVTGGLSLKGDVFSEDEGSDAAGSESAEPAAEVKEKEGGGLSLGGDIFGDEAEPAPAPKKDAKKTSKKKKAKKKKAKKSRGVFDDPPAEEEEAAEAPAPVETPKPTVAPKPTEAPAPAVDPAKKKEATSADGFTVKEHIEAATKYLAQVDSSSEFAAKAKFLEGVLMYRDKRDNDALEAFKSVVRMTKPGSVQEDRYLRQLAFFQLARAHFGAKQPSFSIYYYGKVRRLTYEWLEALYEGSWAEFRLGNYEKALGNLLTLHSPFFRDQYFPESLILKAVVYYENCRYPEAKAILTDFQKRYEPVYEELKTLTARNQQADKYYEVLANLRGGEDVAQPGAEKAEILSQILGIALSDAELQRLDESAREVDAEIKAFEEAGPVFAQSRLRGQLDEQLQVVRADYQKEAGRAVKRKLEGEREAIKTLIQQAIRIDIETARAEQERIESTLRDVQSAPKDLDREFVEWTDDEKLVWPFADEYWRDELGTYEVALGHSCR